jgi:CheY-like chemotaxis protein
MTTEQYAAALRRAAEQAGLFKSAQQQVEQTTRRKIEATVDDEQETRRLIEAQREAERQARELTEALVALGVRSREEVQLGELRKQMDLLHLAFAQGKDLGLRVVHRLGQLPEDAAKRPGPARFRRAGSDETRQLRQGRRGAVQQP